MLAIDNLHVSYGGIKALRGINLKIDDGKIVTLIGSNGAGKSSTLRAIMNLVKKQEGSIKYDEDDLTNLPTKDICFIQPNTLGKRLISVGSCSFTLNNSYLVFGYIGN